jgi:hypothetical protein
MPRINKEWKVLPHGAVKAIDDRILTVEGEIQMPLAKFPRRMTVVGLSRNRTAIFSAMALKEAAMHRIEEMGEPSFLIVPNGHHRLDARPWKERYPKLKVLCPPGAKQSVGEAVQVDSTEDIINDSDVDFVVVEGTGEGEAALLVRRMSGTTLVVNDVIANVRHAHGLGGKIVVRVFGFGAKGPEIPLAARRVMIDDKKKFAEQLREWSEMPDLRRIVPSHGEIVTVPEPVLERLADELA